MVFSFNHYLRIASLITKGSQTNYRCSFEESWLPANRLLGIDRSVGGDLECQLIVIGAAADTRVLNRVAYRINRGVE